MRKSIGSGAERPSNRVNPPTVQHFNFKDPLKSNGAAQAAPQPQRTSAFAANYESGRVPCRLQHGSVKHRLQWLETPASLPFDPLLVWFAEGLVEQLHPYCFIARHGFRELLETRSNSDANQEIGPLLTQLTARLRVALSTSNMDVFQAALDALCQLSNVAGTALNSQLKQLLTCLTRKVTDAKCKANVQSTLSTLETNGGKDAYLIIKAKIPTYTTVL